MNKKYSPEIIPLSVPLFSSPTNETECDRLYLTECRPSWFWSAVLISRTDDFYLSSSSKGFRRKTRQVRKFAKVLPLRESFREFALKHNTRLHMRVLHTDKKWDAPLKHEGYVWMENFPCLQLYAHIRTVREGEAFQMKLSISIGKKANHRKKHYFKSMLMKLVANGIFL